jgi:hypothetical protein
LTEKEESTLTEAEKHKKQLYYDPNTCPDIGQTGCRYPDCDNCEVPQADVDDEEYIPEEDI